MAKKSKTEIEFDGNAAKAINEMRKLVRQNDDLLKSQRALARASEKSADVSTKAMREQSKATRKLSAENAMLKNKVKEAGRSTDEAFGAKTLGKIGAISGGLIGIRKATQMAIDALKEMQRVRLQAAREGREAGPGLAQLGQVADETTSMAQLQVRAEKFYGAGASPSLGAAADVVFALKSAQSLDAQGIVQDLAASAVAQDPAGLVEAAKTIQSSFGKGEAGSIRGIFSKAFAASGQSPSRVPELLQAGASAGSVSAGLGFTDESIMAAVAMAATAAGSASTGGTQIEGLLTTIKKKHDVLGKPGTFREAVSAIAEKTGNMSLAEQVKFFGRKEGQQGFSTVSRQMDDFDRIRGLIVQAEKDDLAGKKAKIPGTDPNLAANYTARVGEAQLVLSRRRLGITESLQQGVSASAQAQMRDLGVPESALMIHRKKVAAMGLVGPGANLATDFHFANKNVRESTISALKASRDKDAATIAMVRQDAIDTDEERRAGVARLNPAEAKQIELLQKNIETIAKLERTLIGIHWAINARSAARNDAPRPRNVNRNPAP